MLTNQRRVSVDQSERRSSTLDQSEPSSQNAHARYPSEDKKGTGPSFLRISFCDTYPTRRQFAKESCGADLKHVCLGSLSGVK